jgi:hypothetical protein
MVTSHVIVTRLKQKLKTLAILAVCLYPPIGTYNVFKWKWDYHKVWKLWYCS